MLPLPAGPCTAMYLGEGVADGSSRKYENGGVGMLLHAIALHGRDYSIELEVYADGVSYP